MNINSESIQKKEFHMVFKGYKPEEVDKFLDILSVEFDRLSRSNKGLQESLDKIKFEGSDKELKMRKVIEDALISAHKTAEEIKEGAQREADEIIKTRGLEEEQSYKELLQKKQELEKKVKHIQDKYGEFKNETKKMLEDFMKFISKMDSSYKLDQLEKVLDKESSEEEKKLVHSASSDYDNEDFFNIEESLKVDENKIKDKAIMTDAEKEKDKDKNKDKDKEKDTEKEKEKDEDKDEDDKESLDKSKRDYELKRDRRKIDIANPDIIDEFFRTDED